MTSAPVPGVRSWVESTFSCEVRVERYAGQTMDPVTLEMVDTYEAIFEGKALVYARDLDARKVISGEATFVISKYVVVLPAQTPVRIKDRVTVTASPHQPQLVGYQISLADVPLDPWGVALQCVGDVVERP